MSLSVTIVTTRALLVACLCSFAWPLQAALTLDEAVVIARENDPWLQGSQYRESALQAQSTAAGTLPDPVVSVGFANLPTDSWDFDQENMTQFKVGVVQQFPRGDSRELNRKRLQTLSSQHPHQRDERRAEDSLDVVAPLERPTLHRCAHEQGRTRRAAENHRHHGHRHPRGKVTLDARSL